MTREEQITFNAGCLSDGCIAHGALAQKGE